MDKRQPLLTPGPLVDAIVDETFKVRATEEQVAPYLALVNELGTFRDYLVTQQTMLEAAATIAWSGLSEERWVKAERRRLDSEIEMAALYSTESYYRNMYTNWVWKWSNLNGHRTSVFEPWIQGNKTRLAILQTNATRLREGDLEVALSAWGHGADSTRAVLRLLEAESGGAGQMNLTYRGGTLELGDLYGSYRERSAAIQTRIYEAAAANLPSALVNYTLFQTQRFYGVEPALRPVERAIQIETGRANYRMYKTQRDEQNLVVGRILTAFEHFKRECSEKGGTPLECSHIDHIDKHLAGLFTRLRMWGYAIPDATLELILRSGGGEPWAQTISRRDLDQAMAIEEFRRSPSPYPTMILVGALLGFTAFWMSFLYSFFTILNMGLLGTAGNLVGVAYEWTGGLHDRAQISRQRLKLETRRVLVLEQGAS